MKRIVIEINRTIPILVVGKPRMTQRDKWQQRPNVVRYRVFADRLRAALGMVDKLTLSRPARLHVVCEFPMPATWSEKKKRETGGTPHTSKPDINNILKGIEDALIENDQLVYEQSGTKYWSEDGEPKIIVHLS